MQPSHAQPNKRAQHFSKNPDLIAALALLIAFLLLNLAILIKDGIRIGGDSRRYLSGAQNLLQGLALQSSQTFYLGYVAVIAFCQRTGIGLPGVIAIQLIFAALAAMALYDLGRRLHGRRAGLIAAALFVANPDIARWNAFILTDSLYISLVILSVWVVHTTALRRKRYWYVIAVALLIAAALVRLNGWVLMAVSVLYLLSRVVSRKSLRWLAVSAVAITFISAAIAAARVFPTVNGRPPISTWSGGITGIPSWRVSMPPAPAPLEGTWAEALSYVAWHPLASLRLACARVAIELIHGRPSYSVKHNLVLAAILPFLYLLALIGTKLNRERSLLNFIILVIAAHLTVVALTFADWDGRYLLYILPLIGLLSSCAIVSLIDLYRGTMKAKRGTIGVEDNCVSE